MFRRRRKRMLGREEEEYERKILDRVLIKRVLGYFLKLRRKLVIASVAVLLASLASLLPPYLIKVAIDNYISAGNFAGLTLISLILVGVYLVYWISDYQRNYQISWLGQSMVNDIRKQLFSHLQDLSFSFYDASEAGEVISRVTNDTDSLGIIFAEGVVIVISDVLTLVGIVALMLLMNVHLTLVALLTSPLLLIAAFAFQSRLRRAYRATRREIAQVTSRLQESISGIREIQSFTREQDTIELFRQANIENLQANVQAGRLFALLVPVVRIVGAIGICVLLWYSAILALGGGVTLGVVVAFLLLVTQFFRPIIELTTLYNTVQSAMAATERIFEVLDTKPEITDASDALELPTVKGEITFDNVTFGYDPSHSVLRDINLHIEPGKTLAIVGPTGAGKSTLVKLLSRFYETQSGTIKVDGYNISKVTQKSLRRQMGVVLQEPFLFSGTVMENIKYGKLDATDEEVKEVARMVGAHDFICDLPEGYETEVGERGARLSLGQRQLVSFARALLRNPPILILDEATSSVDPHTELIIKRGLAVLLKNRTSLVIAHRLSTVINADNIIALANGRILEEGSHRELMKKKGLYRRLYKKQFKDI